jgi:hypothetical protein
VSLLASAAQEARRRLVSPVHDPGRTSTRLPSMACSRAKCPNQVCALCLGSFLRPAACGVQRTSFTSGEQEVAPDLTGCGKDLVAVDEAERERVYSVEHLVIG